MSRQFSLTDSQGKTIRFQPGNLSFAGSWDDGLLNVFFQNNRVTESLRFSPGEEKLAMQDIAEALSRSGKESILLDDPNLKTNGYRFLFRPELVQFFSIKNKNSGVAELVIEDVPFYADPSIIASVRAKLDRANSQGWIVFAPEKAGAQHSPEGVFAARKDRVALLAGYLNDRVILEMHDRTRLFVPIDRDDKRAQIREVAKLFPNFIGVGGEKSTVFMRPERFEPRYSGFQKLDFGEGKVVTLIVEQDGWHVPFASDQAAQNAWDELEAARNATLAVKKPGANKPGPMTP